MTQATGSSGIVVGGSNVTAILSTCRTMMHDVCTQARKEDVMRLLECLERLDGYGNEDKYDEPRIDWAHRALMYAAEMGWVEAVEVLLREGASVWADRDTTMTPLHYAAIGGHVAVIDVLLREGAKAYEQDVEGWTPLHFAANEGHVAAVNALLQVRYIDVDAENEDGMTPLNLAARNGHMAVVRALMRARAEEKRYI